jgi:GH24 family phage-related lysozyme (muramidase)
MRPSVLAIFPSFSAKFEGRVHFCYLDIKGLVTIGVGNLIDPVGAALHLPFVHSSDNSPASPSEIAAEWSTIKQHTGLAKEGYQAAGRIAKLMLTDDSIDVLVRRRLLADEAYLKKTFLDWEAWPADAQLAVLSMAWALGAGFTRVFKSFSACCDRLDWSGAAANCSINSTGNPGIVPRNIANHALLIAAQSVAAQGLDPEQIYGFAQ